MRRRGHPVLGVVAGLVFGVALGLVLLVFGAVALDSKLLAVLPVAGLVVGVVVGVVAPFGSRGVPDPGARRDA